MQIRFRVHSAVRLTALALSLLGVSTAAMATSYEVAWSHQFGTATQDASSEVAIDMSGNVFLAWTTDGLYFEKDFNHYDTALSKYDPHGNLLWIRSFESEVTDSGLAVATDTSGNAFFGGATTAPRDDRGNPARGGGFLRRIDSEGNVLWDKRFIDGESGQFNSLSITPNGDVYAAGPKYLHDAEPRNGSAAVIGKFDSHGNRLWNRTFDTELSDSFWDVSADEIGNVFASGATAGVLGEESFGSADALTVKLNADGETVWIRQWGTPYYDQNHAVAADGVGGAYFAGISPSGEQDTESWTGSDAFVGRYSPDGDLMWIRYLTTLGFDSTAELAVSQTGRVYVSGSTSGTLGATNAGSVDFFVAELNSDGDLQWLKQFGSNEIDSAPGLVVDFDENLYVSGSTHGDLVRPHLGGRGDAFLIRLSESQIPEPSCALLLILASGAIVERDSRRPR